MTKSTRVALSALFVALTASVTGFILLRSAYREASVEVCQLVEENYYRRNEPEAREFVRLCRAAAERQKFLLTKAANIARINNRLSMLKTSHLSVYDPDENRMMWENQGLDTGIRSRMVEDLLIVHSVVSGSVAARAGIKPGDALLTVNGEMVPSSSVAQSVGGLYRVRRGSREMEFEIRPEQLAEDLAPTLTDLGAGVAWLKIPSFLSQYFESKPWQVLLAKLARFPRVVIDLRDNPGGSFPAMLRALSPFRCEDPMVGRIFSSTLDKHATEADLRDTLDSQSQIEQLSDVDVVRLKAFRNYGCYDGAAIVLIDSGTSSVSEIFAQAFQTRRHSDVWGQPSAGQVVMARWFPVPALGAENYLISIPIAGYMTANGVDLEERGVHPRVLLQYDVSRSLEGRDPWLEDAKAELLRAKSKGHL